MSEPTAATPRRKRFTVSLRVLMVLILVFACGLGWKVRRANAQRRAVAQLKKSRHDVFYDYEYSHGQFFNNGSPRAPAWLQRALGDEYFQHVTRVDMSLSRPLTEVDVAALQRCDRLESITVYGYRHLTDAELAFVGNLTSLRELSVHDAPITDAGLTYLKRLTHLRTLDFDQHFTAFSDSSIDPQEALLNEIRETRAIRAELSKQNLPIREMERQIWLRRYAHITGTGLADLAGLTALEQLTLHAPGVTDDGLVHLKAMTRLRTLDLANTGITGAGFQHLQGATQIEELKLHSTGITDAGLAYLPQWPKLRVLNLSNTDITDSGLAHVDGMNRLEELDLSSCEQITDAGLVALKDLKNLRTLDLPEGIGDAGLVQLAGLQKLESLNLAGANITDAGLVHLRGLTALRVLNISLTRVTDAGLVNLRGLRALRTIGLRVNTVTDAAVDALKEAIPGLEEIHRTGQQTPAENSEAARPQTVQRLDGQ